MYKGLGTGWLHEVFRGRRGHRDRGSSVDLGVCVGRRVVGVSNSGDMQGERWVVLGGQAPTRPGAADLKRGTRWNTGTYGDDVGGA